MKILLILAAVLFVTAYGRQHLGCWRDNRNRAIKGGKRIKRSSVEKCEQYAKKHHWSVFAVQHGGDCYTGPKAHETYNKYRKVGNCKHGKGGRWAQDVYRVEYHEHVTVTAAPVSVHGHGLRSMGCWKDAGNRAIAGGIRFKGTVEKCAQYARDHHYSVFAVQNGGECFTGPNAHATYNKYGHAKNCDHGKGGGWANDVYNFGGLQHHVTLSDGHGHRSLGCYKDNKKRAISSFRFKGTVVQCEQYARHHHYSVFAVQAGGECFTGPKAHATYKKYGHAKNCAHGRGGDWANDAYAVEEIHISASGHERRSLGCWKDTGKRAISSFRFKGTVAKCEEYARDHHYSVFAMQAGGECYTGPNAHATYKKYGHAKNCDHGKGGGWANDVYTVGGVGETSQQRTTIVNSRKSVIRWRTLIAVQEKTIKGYESGHAPIQKIINTNYKAHNAWNAKANEAANNVHLARKALARTIAKCHKETTAAEAKLKSYVDKYNACRKESEAYGKKYNAAQKRLNEHVASEKKAVAKLNSYIKKQKAATERYNKLHG